MKKVNIVKYICSDGKEFIGGDKKAMAQAHEDVILKAKSSFDFEKKIGDIIRKSTSMKTDIFNVSKRRLEEDGHDNIYEAYSQAYFEDDIGETIDALFEGYTCPDELNTFREMAEMLYEIADNFGGIEVIKKICDIYDNAKTMGTKYQRPTK